MPRGIIALLLVSVFAKGCVDNETTFFVEHIKVPPEPPECVVSPSDAWISTGLVDLAFRNAYPSHYLVTNQAVSRVDLPNLKTETNGINIDGAESYTQLMNGDRVLDDPEYYQFQKYIGPGASDIAYAVPMTKAVVERLAQINGCAPLTTGMGRFFPVYYDPVYTAVRFLGHTGGGSDVDTPEFTFLVELCCGCLIDWGNCMEPSCSTYCDEPRAHGMCTLGVANGGALLDCRELTRDLTATWTGAPGECVDDEGNDVLCTCANCEG